MILTLTANPSLDRTIELSGPVLRGQVQRAVWAGQQPGGKGVNVSRAVAAADRDTLAVLPGDVDDPVLTGLDSIDWLIAPFPPAHCSPISPSPNPTARRRRSTNQAHS